MKYIKYLLICICLLPCLVFAGSIKLNKTSLNITKGKTSNFTITANSAAGRVDISSLNTTIANVGSSSVWLDNSNQIINVNAIGVGSTKIKISLTDVSGYDGKLITGTYYVDVNVLEVDSRSSNNSLKTLSVDGYTLVKESNTIYTLDVPNNVSNINIVAIPSDEKASVSGAGNVNLLIGLNTFILSVKAENGSVNNITINVNRRDGFSLSELDSAIEINSDVTLVDGEVLDADNLNKVKQSGKKVTFNYRDDTGKTLYSWIIDGSSIDNLYTIDTNVKFESINKSQINKLMNYANGIIVSFNHNGSIPAGVSFKTFIGDNYANDDKVNVYYFDENNNQMTLYKENINVANGYIEYSMDHASEYFITMSKLDNTVINNIVNSSSNLGLIFIIISVVELLIIIALIVLLILNRKKLKQYNY